MQYVFDQNTTLQHAIVLINCSSQISYCLRRNTMNWLSDRMSDMRRKQFKWWIDVFKQYSDRFALYQALSDHRSFQSITSFAINLIDTTMNQLCEIENINKTYQNNSSLRKNLWKSCNNLDRFCEWHVIQASRACVLL